MKRVSIFSIALLVGLFAFTPNIKALSIPTSLEEDMTLSSQENIGADEDITINLNGHTLTIETDFQSRAIINEGTLTIKNGKIKNTNTSSYGAIDNYGTLIVEDVVFEDNGMGNGATLKNRADGTMTIKNTTIRNDGVNLGNAAVASNGTLTIKNSEFTTASNRAYATIIFDGSADITNLTSMGTHGGLSVNSGTVVVNSGTFKSENYYGIWITNNGTLTDVTINDGKFIGNGSSVGKGYALRAGIDDGKQDAGNVKITVNGGEFTSEASDAKAIYVTNATSTHTWDISLKGGKYISSETDYVADEYTVYKKGDIYEIAKRGSLEITDGPIYLNKNEEFENVYTTELGDYVTLTLTMEDETLNPEEYLEVNGTTIKGLKSGTVTLTARLNDMVNPIEKTVNVIIYEIAETIIDADEGNETNNAIKDAINTEVSNVLKKILANEEVVGITDEVKEAIKANFLANKTIGSTLMVKQVDNITTSDEEILAVVDNNSVIDGYYDVQIIITADGTANLGNLTQTTNAIKITLPIPENVEAVPTGYERSYNVVRVHNGQIQKIPTVMNNDGTISFNTSEFSDFIITHVDVPTGQLDDVPTTGEIMLPLGIIALISLLAALALNTLRKVDEVR